MWRSLQVVYGMPKATAPTMTEHQNRGSPPPSSLLLEQQQVQ